MEQNRTLLSPPEYFCVEEKYYSDENIQLYIEWAASMQLGRVVCKLHKYAYAGHQAGFTSMWHDSVN